MPVQDLQCILARQREVHRVKPRAHLAAELLAEQRLYVGLVVHHQHPDATPLRRVAHMPSWFAC